jgi:hypothetical protein
VAALASTLGFAPGAFGAEPAVSEHDTGQTPAEVNRYWTPERMERAQPPDQEIAPARDTAYPERVHGILFITLGGRDGGCSATVVTSLRRNLILTAGHCVVISGGEGVMPQWATNVLFVPGYRNGTRPFGSFAASELRAPLFYAFEGDPALDLGAINLAPGPGGLIQDQLGSRGVSFSRPRSSYRGTRFQIFGYPGNPPAFYDGQRPILCDSPFLGFERFTNALIAGPCHQQEGSSGGGWIDQRGLLNSVVAHGSCLPATSACELISGTYLGEQAFKVYAQAGGLAKGRKRRIEKCRRIDRRAKRKRCVSRAQTIGPVAR